MDLWAVFGILVLMMLAGVAPLYHIVSAKHTSRDLCCLIPLATLCIVGLITLVDSATSLVFPQSITGLGFDSLGPLTSVNIFILTLLWRAVRMVNMNPAHCVIIYTYFVTSFLGILPLRSLIPVGQQLTVTLAREYPDLFKSAPVENFVIQLCIEYVLFYVPAFFVMFKLYTKRTGLKNKALRGEKDCVLSQSSPEDCQRCATTSPFVDIIAACLAAAMFVVRPLYMAYYLWSYGVVTEIDNHFFILPFYSAVCLLNVKCSRKVRDDNRSNRNLLQVCSG